MRFLITPSPAPEKTGTPNGAQAFLRQLRAHLLEEGHHLTGIDLTDGKGRSEADEVSRKDADEVLWRVRAPLGGRIVRKRVARFPKEAGKATKALDTLIDPRAHDIAVINGISYVNWIALKSIRRAGIPTVIIHHGVLTAEISNARGVTSAGKRLVRRMEREMSGLADVHVFPSRFARRSHEAHVGKMRSGKTVVLPLPYSPVLAEPVRTRPRKRVRVGIAGRWAQVKGHDTFLAVAKEADRRGLEWEFVAATRPDDRASLAHIRREYERHVTVLGLLSPKDLRDFYASLDALLMPSRFETYGLVALEALLQGATPVVWKVTGVAEELRAQGLGRCVMGSDDPKAVVSRLSALVDRRLPEKVRSRFRVSHSPKKVFREYGKVFRSLTTKRFV